MYAVEFRANIKNGAIQIPEAYRARFQQQVRVILLSDDTHEEPAKQSIIDVLAAAPGQRAFKTASEVDQYLHEERGAWDL